MTEQVQSLLHYILAKKHHEGRAAIDEPPVSKEKSIILRRSERFVRRCRAEQPRLLPGERIGADFAGYLVESAACGVTVYSSLGQLPQNIGVLIDKTP